MGLCQKIRSYYDLAGMYHVSSIFIGGGTPAILESQQMRSIFDAIRATFPIDSDAEITVEVNPGTVDKLKLMAYRNVGINRLSIGVQSTDDQELKMRISRFLKQKGYDYEDILIVMDEIWSELND